MHLSGIILLAIHGQSAQRPQHRAHEYLREERCLGQRSRRPAGAVEDQQRIKQRIGVIGRDQHGTIRQRSTGLFDLVEDAGRPADQARNDGRHECHVVQQDAISAGRPANV